MSAVRIPHPALARPAAALAAALLLLTIRSSAAQERAPRVPPPRYVHDAWTAHEGMPVNSVTDLLQTRDGYLWISTFNGLARFDGVRFTVFDQSNAPALGTNRVLRLRESGDGRLWLLTQTGDVLWLAGGTLHRLAPPAGVRSSIARTLIIDPHGDPWVGTHAGVWHVRGDRATRFEAGGELEAEALDVDRHGTVWIAGRWGLARVSGDHLTRFAPLAADDYPISAFYETGDGRMLVGSRSEIYEIAGERLVPADWRHFPAGTRLVASEHQGYDESVAFEACRAIHERFRASRARGLSVERDPGTWHAAGDARGWLADGPVLWHDGHETWRFPSAITTLASDRHGGLWVGTASSGLHLIRPAQVSMVADSLAGRPVNLYALAQSPDGTMWLGSFGDGLGRATGTRTEWVHPWPRLAQTLTVRRDGTLLVGGFGGGLAQLVGERLVPIARASIDSTRIVFMLHEDRLGRLWVGTDDGLWREQGGAWRRFGAADGVPERPLRSCLERADGSLWFGTNGGGIVIAERDRFHRVTRRDGLPTDVIRGMLEDERGVVWVATEGRGLVRLEGGWEHPRIRAFHHEDGLYDDALHAILQDDEHRLWISSDRGIFRVDRGQLDRYRPGRDTSLACRAFTEPNGMTNREANGGTSSSALRALDGTLWFATQAGAVVIDPRRVGEPPAPPPVVAEEVRGDGNVRVPAVRGVVDLGRSEGDFSVSYTGLAFGDPADMRFRYRLEGLDGRWTDAGDRRTAYYTRVPPGHYTFEVTARSGDGAWNPLPARLPITLRPQPWQTWWFRLGALAMALLATLLAHRARVRGYALRQHELTRQVASRTAELERERDETAQARAVAERARAQAEEARDMAQRSLARIAEQTRELQALDQAKSRFFADISHEFRTPLTLTIGPLEDVLGGLHGALPSGLDEPLALALRNSQRALRQVNRLLDLARLEAGATRLATQAGDLAALTRELARVFQPLAERRRIEFRLRLPELPLEAWFDPILMEQAIANLLSNAIKFAPEGGHVAVEVSLEASATPPDWAVVRVVDDGPGIASAELPHVFDRFHRSRRDGPTRHGGGTGIGLSLAREIVELHAGRIDATSIEGAGSTFTLRLPLGRLHLRDEQIASGAPGAPVLDRPAWLQPETPASVRALPPAMATPPDETPDTRTVLVVEDDPEVRAYLRRHLAERYRVLEAGDGRAALAMARRHTPDLVVSDVMMPRMDGVELCRALKSDPELDFVPVILLTARAGLDEKLEGLAVGADEHLTKPFHASELMARVANLIAVRERLRDRLRPRELHATSIDADSADDRFLEQVRQAIEQHMGDEDFGVNTLAGQVGHERSRFYRRLGAVLGETPEALIRRMRLERAAQLLDSRVGTVGEVAYAVGFKSVAHFCKTFRERFGVTPGAWPHRERRPAAAGEPPPA